MFCTSGSSSAPSQTPTNETQTSDSLSPSPECGVVKAVTEFIRVFVFETLGHTIGCDVFPSLFMTAGRMPQVAGNIAACFDDAEPWFSKNSGVCLDYQKQPYYIFCPPSETLCVDKSDKIVSQMSGLGPSPAMQHSAFFRAPVSLSFGAIDVRSAFLYTRLCIVDRGCSAE
jgi:hypothetical protein